MLVKNKAIPRTNTFRKELLSITVVSLAEIITNVDEVDLIMFNSISNPIQKSNKNNLDVVQLAASVRVTNS